MPANLLVDSFVCRVFHSLSFTNHSILHLYSYHDIQNVDIYYLFKFIYSGVCIVFFPLSFTWLKHDVPKNKCQVLDSKIALDVLLLSS